VLFCFTLILIVLISVLIVSLRNLNRSVATSDWVNHTHALINELDTLQPMLASAHGQLTRYLLTSDQRDEEAYQENFADVNESVEVINSLIAGSADEKEQFGPIATLVARRIALATEAARLHRAGVDTALKKLLADDDERGDRRELARRVEKFRQRQTDLLSERDRASFVQTQVARWTVLAGVALDFLLLVGAAWLIRGDLAARRQAAQLLRQSNSELEERVRERTAEITAVNAQLVAQNLEERWSKQALEHQNHYNLLIIDSISDAVFVITKLMNISRMNPSAVHLTGFEPVKLVDKPLTRVVQLAGADTAQATYDPLARALADGHELRERSGVVTAGNGLMLPVLISLFPLRDRDKVVGGVVVIKSASPLSP
jgi:CHASE3 domain sensor protein